jgi:hypothetical protein
MNVKSLSWSRGFTLSLFVAITLACGIREDEFDCENAYSHLQQCCGNDSTLGSVDCHYTAGGCDEGPTYPAINIFTSDCIRSAPCDAIRASGVCSGTPFGALCPGGDVPSQTPPYPYYDTFPDASSAEDASSDGSMADDASTDIGASSDGTAADASIMESVDAARDASGVSDAETTDRAIPSE